MLEKIPTDDELRSLLGEDAHGAWMDVVRFIAGNYDMETSWDSGRKAGVYERKFRRSGKTLCALYAREGSFGFMVVLGRAEREKFEAAREDFPPEVRKAYDETRQYHDGKWLMIEVRDGSRLAEMEDLLRINKEAEASEAPLKKRPPTMANI